jgi:hypothetical protein
MSRLYSKRRSVTVAALALLALAWLAAACLPMGPLELTPTPVPPDTATPTATIVWFPPSPTSTLRAVPTSTGTPEMSPGIGAQIVKDDFSDDSVWDTAASENASAIVGMNRLSLAAQPGYYLSSMRRELPLTDFYAEITASPSLCRGDDNYGIIVRGVGSSFYRFVLTCNGEVRAERISGGTRLPIYDPVPSGDVARPPGEVRIGIWAVGEEMRLFLNDRFQFSVRDPKFPIGAFGVFVRSNGDEPVSVTFSDFQAYDVNYILPTKTPIPTP